MRHVVQMGEIRDAYTFSLKKSNGKRPLGRHRHKWNDIIINLK
jgi:hypothetical protein